MSFRADKLRDGQTGGRTIGLMDGHTHQTQQQYPEASGENDYLYAHAQYTFYTWFFAHGK